MQFTFAHNNINVIDLKVICYENPGMGIYFIEDPDGYGVEILPQKR